MNLLTFTGLYNITKVMERKKPLDHFLNNIVGK